MKDASPFGVPSTPPRLKKPPCMTMAYTPRSVTPKHTQNDRVGKQARTPKRSPVVDFDAHRLGDSASPFCTPDELTDPHRGSKRFDGYTAPAASTPMGFSGNAGASASPHTPLLFPGLSLFLPTPQTAGPQTALDFQARRKSVDTRKSKPSLLESLRLLADSPVLAEAPAPACTHSGHLLQAPTLFSAGSRGEEPFQKECSPSPDESCSGPFLPQTPQKNGQSSPKLAIHDPLPRTPTHNPVIEQKPQFEQFFGIGPDSDAEETVQIVDFRDLGRIARANIPNPFITSDAPRPSSSDAPAVDLSTHMEFVHPRTGRKFITPLSDAQKEIKPRKLDFTLAVDAPGVPGVNIANRYVESRMGRNFGMGEPRVKGALDFDIFNDEE